MGQLWQKLNGKLTESDRAYIEGAFRLLQNKLLHGPISALAEEVAGSGAAYVAGGTAEAVSSGLVSGKRLSEPPASAGGVTLTWQLPR